MNSAANRSEVALARLACAELGERPAPRVLIGGLGMGCTLRAALDALPARGLRRGGRARTRRCCAGAAARWRISAGTPSTDPRVAVRIGDVATAIREAAESFATRFDAVLLDLYEGPHPASQPRDHPHYGAAALARTRSALRPGGILAIWSEDPDTLFERELGRAGFAVRRERPGRGGRRHVVYLASAV